MRKKNRFVGWLAISPLRQKDQLAWAGTKQGYFTVRSAYHLAKKLAVIDQGGCSNEGRMERMWQTIWKLDCPRVVHLFLWKACNNILPTKECLHKRGITPDAKCPICLTETESAGHSLWNCIAAKDIWMECSLSLQKCPSFEDEFSNIFQNLVERLPTEDLSLMAFVARQIWHRRNEVVFNSKFCSPGDLIPVWFS